MSRPQVYDVRGYHRAMALYCLNNNASASTAADLAEQMGVLSQNEGHPRDLWISITPASVAGTLRTLQNDNAVLIHGYSKNTRSGRDEPRWLCRGGPNEKLRMPNPAMFESTPETPEAATAPLTRNADRYDQLSRSELYMLLEVHDDIAGATSRFLRELEDINRRARDRLISAGLEAAG